MNNNEKQEIKEKPLYAYKNFNLTNKGYYGNGKVVFEKKLKSLSAIRFGMEDNYSNEKSIYGEYTGNSFLAKSKRKYFIRFWRSRYLCNQ